MRVVKVPMYYARIFICLRFRCLNLKILKTLTKMVCTHTCTAHMEFKSTDQYFNLSKLIAACKIPSYPQ